jgi:CheY-like chemotaxis protein
METKWAEQSSLSLVLNGRLFNPQSVKVGDEIDGFRVKEVWLGDHGEKKVAFEGTFTIEGQLTSNFFDNKAYSGEEGLKLLDSKALPDLVIVDLKMPGIKGKEVIQAVRQNPNFDDVPVMILTCSVKNDNDFPSEDSYQDHITKPFNIEEV